MLLLPSTQILPWHPGSAELELTRSNLGRVEKNAGPATPLRFAQDDTSVMAEVKQPQAGATNGSMPLAPRRRRPYGQYSALICE